MRIFEIAWLSIAVLAFGLGIYKIINGSEKEFSYYLFLITFLGIMMFFIKRKSRKFLEKRYDAIEKQQRSKETTSEKKV